MNSYLPKMHFESTYTNHFLDTSANKDNFTPLKSDYTYIPLFLLSCNMTHLWSRMWQRENKILLIRTGILCGFYLKSTNKKRDQLAIGISPVNTQQYFISTLPNVFGCTFELVRRKSHCGRRWVVDHSIGIKLCIVICVVQILNKILL